MSANLLVKVAIGAVVLAMVAVAVSRCSRDEAASVVVAPTVGGEPLAPETAAALGIEGDTPDDIVRTLIANVRETNERLATLEGANADLRDENAGLRNMRESVVAEVTGELSDEAARLREENRDVVADARAEIAGLRDEIERLLKRAPAAARGKDGDARAAGTVWIRPLE
ncbi:MAG: hypothetical protein OXG72_08560, partial [Acidobacteria bacterium]|nr:hypothetical protein [Acidobacteriota bacterium]